MANNLPPPPADVAAPFTASELEQYLRANADAIRRAGRFSEIAAVLDSLAGEAAAHLADLETLEQRLTALEDRILALARAQQSDEDLFDARRELDLHLRPYRSRMTAGQLTMLERQFLDRRIFEKLRLPRLSLFYLR